ncbi:electron transfer flavoprotein subunit beta [Vibrio sp. S4M6]|uniref:electron transfer flavoprotein subunit beta n=1 Tax=Vibrio sinus TaxID=2946865 RepID=UPI002029B87F|nr:electron transfer flavoprotein subunit beta [Vibrio sinus]MCL9783381.1 electron transfer flavoprotein subunit beta [Vibrio sinus]
MPLKPTPSLRISALVSVGVHPDSGRSRRAATDARAIELALNIDNIELEVVHAGDPYHPALREYAGMGLSHLRVIAQDEQRDAIDSLATYLTNTMPDIVLTGTRAESGESSGLLPFFLSQRMACPLVSGITNILQIENGYAEVLQALPRGQRRSLRVPLPFVASVHEAAKPPRQNAFGLARRTHIDITKSESTTLDNERMSWQTMPAKARAKRLKVVKAKTAAERFKAATVKASASGGRVMKDQSVQEKAQAVFDLMLEEGVIR